MSRKLMIAVALAGTTFLAGEALAAGACVYVSVAQGSKQVVCEQVGAQSVCDHKSVAGGEYYGGQVCSQVGHAPPGPAKGDFSAIPSPVQPGPAKADLGSIPSPLQPRR